MTRRHCFAAGLLLLAAGCAHEMPAACDAASPPGAVAWIVDHGWHTEIAMPAHQVTGPLAVYRDVFPGAQTLSFGFGKRSFMTAQSPSLGDFLAGPIPGAGAIQVTGLRAPPGQIYPGRTIQVPLPPNGTGTLSAFVWRSIAHPSGGVPMPVAAEAGPGSAFYASEQGYNLAYTCNTWVAEAMLQAGLPVGTSVVLASGAMNEAARIKGACAARP